MNVGVPIVEHLRASHGATLNRFAIEIWSDFVAAIVQALAVAGERLSAPPHVDDYPLRTGWWRARARRNRSGLIVRIPNEDSLTDALVDMLEQLRREARPGDALYDLNIAFSGQQPRRRQRRIGPASLTTDIRAHVPDTFALDFRVEAKVVFETADVDREYLGSRGLLRFAEADQPYSDTIAGAMLGYYVAPFNRPWHEVIHAGLQAVPGLRSVGYAVPFEGADPVPVGDFISPTDGARVSVLHLGLRFETEPSSF